MSKTKMRWQGGSCIVLRYDPVVGCWRESSSMSYWQARAAVGTDNCRNAHCEKPTHDHTGCVYKRGKGWVLAET